MASIADGAQVDVEDAADQPLMKPLPDLGSSELRELGAAITQDIYTSNQGVSWEDVAGLEGAKHLLREALVMPLQFPDIFTGILAPWKVIVRRPAVCLELQLFSSHDSGTYFAQSTQSQGRKVSGCHVQHMLQNLF